MANANVSNCLSGVVVKTRLRGPNGGVDLPVPPAPALYKVWRFPLPLVTSRIDVAWKFRWWFDVPGIKGNSAGTVPLRVWSGVIGPMSAFGYERTFCQTLIYVRFTPES